MKEMKTLTINGVTYTVTDPDAASIDDSKVGADAWSSKNIVDKLCPAFTESGAIVTCEPVAGYPLTVTADAEATTITRCGKNLLDLSAGNVKAVNWIRDDGAVSPNYWGVEIILPPGTYTIKAVLADGATADTTRDYIHAQANDLAGIYIKPFAQQPVSGGTLRAAQTATFTDWVRLYVYAGLAIADANYPQKGAEAMLDKYNVQLEVGNAAAAFEPYNGGTFDPGDTIPALPGINTIYADAGTVTVTGRADPNAINRKTAERLAALEAALVNT